MTKAKEISVILAHALIGWALCGAIIGVGRSFTSMENTLIIHAIGAPVLFTAISGIYYKKFNFTNPVTTEFIFTAFIMSMDFFVVALFVEKSLEMFKSVLGTWIPFASIFITTHITGRIINGKT